MRKSRFTEKQTIGTLEEHQARMSTRLFELAFSQEALFPKVVDAILPLVRRVEGENLSLLA